MFALQPSSLIRSWSARAGLLVAALAAGLESRSCEPSRGPLRVGTFNIREFGRADTDLARLRGVIRETGAAVLALQELQSEERLRALLLGIDPRGRWEYALAQCGGRGGMFVGFLWDRRRVRALEREDYPELLPEGGACTEGDRGGLRVRFEPEGGGEPFELLSVHLRAGGGADRFAQRKAQWDRALALVAARRRAGVARVALLGDVNSTGWLDNALDERSFIEERTRAAGLEVPTEGLACSEYWRPRRDGPWEPNLLDHLVSTPGFARAGSARVQGYCERLACARVTGSAPSSDYERVSDHCPVTVELAP